MTGRPLTTFERKDDTLLPSALPNLIQCQRAPVDVVKVWDAPPKSLCSKNSVTTVIMPSLRLYGRDVNLFFCD